MNNKEFVTELSIRLGYSVEDTTQLISSMCSIVAEELEEGNFLSVQNFGSFEVKKKSEKILINPSTQQRMLVPPKLAICFKPSTQLKDKFK
jgi:DNA-binding protein HU-beta